MVGFGLFIKGLKHGNYERGRFNITKNKASDIPNMNGIVISRRILLSTRVS